LAEEREAKKGIPGSLKAPEGLQILKLLKSRTLYYISKQKKVKNAYTPAAWSFGSMASGLYLTAA